MVSVRDHKNQCEGCQSNHCRSVLGILQVSTHQEGELEHEDRYVHVQKGNFTFVVILVGVWCSGLSFFDSLLW